MKNTPTSSCTLQTISVLLIEDSKIDREIFKQLLLRDGEAVYTVVEAEDLADAKAALQHVKPDCILLDYLFPGGDGISFLDELQRMDMADIPVVMITAHEKDNKAIEALQRGAEDYLVKGECHGKLLSRTIAYAIERKKSRYQQKMLEQALEKEREINQLQKDFVSLVSHEFRTPLAIIDTSSQLMDRNNGEVKNGMGKHVTKIRRSVKRLTSLIDNALSFATLEEGKVVFQPRQFNMKLLISEILDRYADMFPERKIKASLENLPSVFYGDPKICDQIITNILNNAVKYSEEDTNIEVKSQKKGDFIELIVKDKGIGIPSEDLKNITEKFYRGENSRGIAGTGMGLYLTQSFLELHNGKMDIKSTLNKGTTITLRFPVKQSVPLSEIDTAAKHA